MSAHTHILDNPIWHALQTGNRSIAFGSDNARYTKRDVGLFAGLRSNAGSDLHDLHALLPEQEIAVLFIPGELDVPGEWNIQLQKPILQMVHEGMKTDDQKDAVLQSLMDDAIPAMLQLTALTKPGPFLQRTLDFGNYEGVFDNGQLVAMAGQRLQPDPYTEISAVCTHPGHTGKGYAAKLLRSQIADITAASRIPFLHVYPENTVACTLYQKLGFQVRKQMMVYVLKKL